jgi:hypothetical protein
VDAQGGQVYWNIILGLGSVEKSTPPLVEQYGQGDKTRCGKIPVLRSITTARGDTIVYIRRGN